MNERKIKFKTENRLPRELGDRMLSSLDKRVEEAQEVLQDLEKDGEQGHDWAEASEKLTSLEDTKVFMEKHFSDMFVVKTAKEIKVMRKRISNLQDELDYGELYLEELNSEEEENSFEIIRVADLCNTLAMQINRLKKELGKELED